MLSILIPSYNHAAFVKAAIASARSISIPGKRIVVIDDASPDGSAKLISEYLDQEDARDVELICKPVNKGAVDSVNMFLANCESEFVYFMASDDVAIAPGIETLVRRLEREPGLQFLIGGGSNLFPDGSRTPIYSGKHDAFFSLEPRRLVRATFLDCPTPILCQSSVFRLSAIRAVGGFDPSMIADDYALFTRLFLAYHRRGIDFDFVPHVPCVEYRHHEINSHRNLPRQALATRQVIEHLAPSDLRNRASGDKLAYYTLVALRRLDLKSTRSLLSMLRLREVVWFVAGLFNNLMMYARHR
ncbi:MAG: glycosyltransferase [Burkholderiaceae bacterium]|nr:MAG: glycosyltransferase [Burkholderiaceae bacterium]